MNSGLKGKKISLVLGGGGAKGLAHIGVIKVLERHGAIIDEVVGCSIGSLIGGIYACGKMDVLEEIARKLSRMDYLRMIDFRFNSSGLLTGGKIFETLRKSIPDVNIEDMPVAFTALVADLVSEEEMPVCSGSMYDAIRASVGVPGVFTALNREERVIVDGGVLNPLPLSHVKRDNLVVAINLEGFPTGKMQIDNLSKAFILQQSFTALRRRLSIFAIEKYKPDYVIDIPDDISGFWEFHRAKHIIEQGESIAAKRLESKYSLWPHGEQT